MGRNLRDLGWWELLTLGLARPDEEGGLQERKKLAAGGWALGLTVEEGGQQGRGWAGRPSAGPRVRGGGSRGRAVAHTADDAIVVLLVPESHEQEAMAAAPKVNSGAAASPAG